MMKMVINVLNIIIIFFIKLNDNIQYKMEEKVSNKPLNKINSHKLFNDSTFITKINDLDYLYKVKSKGILNYVNIWNNHQYIDKTGNRAINKLKKLYNSNIELEIIYIAEIDGIYYNYNNYYKLIALNDQNIDLICNVKYDIDKYKINLLIQDHNEQNIKFKLPNPTNLANDMNIVKEIIINKYSNYLTNDTNPIEYDQNINKLCDGLVYIIKREALNDPETIERLFRFKLIRFAEIFDRINDSFWMYYNDDNDDDVREKDELNAKKYNCYLFIPKLYGVFEYLFCEYLAEDIANPYKSRKINELTTRSISIYEDNLIGNGLIICRREINKKPRKYEINYLNFPRCKIN